MGRVIPFRRPFRPAGDAAPAPTDQSGQMSTLGLIGVAAGVWIGWEVLKAWAIGDSDEGRLPRRNPRRRRHRR